MKTVGIGIAGIGFMGMTHYLASQSLVGARVAAICSRDPRKRSGDWTSIQGNFGPPGAMMDLAGIATHETLDDLLQNSDVDLVCLCVPSDEHAPLAIQCLESGKHVLVEKPIALSLADADRMIAASEASGKLLMVAHVLPYFLEFAFAREAIQSGRYGKLLAAHVSRVIARPDWSDGITNADRSGGPAIDLHIHDTHYLGLICGVPQAVHSRGIVQDGAVVHLTTQYLYDDPSLTVSAISGAISQKGRPFAHAYDIYLERATLSFGFASHGEASMLHPVSVILPDGTVETPDLGDGDPVKAFTREIQDAVDGVRSGKMPKALSAMLARRALATCMAEVESVRSGKSMSVV